jgi:epoxyqueuosine reductase
MPLADVLSISNVDEFKERFIGTALLRSRRSGLVRNACVVCANTGTVDELSSSLEKITLQDDDAVVRGHAAWALGHSRRSSSREILDKVLKTETDPLVLDEAHHALTLVSA